MKTEKEPTISVSTRVTKSMYKDIKRALNQSAYINTADYIRGLIRSDIEQRQANQN